MEQIAKFRFKNYIITYTNININPYKDVSKNIKLNIQRLDEHELGNNIYCIRLSVHINNENNSLNLLTEFLGNFEYNPEITDEEKSIYFKHNAPAILMPYIIAYVSSITSLSGIPTIVLPTYTFLV